MSDRIPPLIACIPFVLAVMLPPVAGAADEADWKRGRIYYRMVCTACHKEMADKISPNSRTIAEWKAYIDADRHDASGRSNPSVKYYTSAAYRESVKAENKAAAKFIDVAEEALLADVRAWLVRGAKASDTPARCQ